MEKRQSTKSGKRVGVKRNSYVTFVSRHLIFMMLIIPCITSAQVKLTVNVAFDLLEFKGEEYSVLNIDYVNNSSDSLGLWVQNWDVVLLNDSTKGFNYPLASRGINSIIFKDSGMIKTPRYTDGVKGVEPVNQESVRLVLPDEVFKVRLTISDSSIVEFLKQGKGEIIIYYSYKLIDEKMKLSFLRDNLELFIPKRYSLIDARNYTNVKKIMCKESGENHKNPTSNRMSLDLERYGTPVELCGGTH